MAKRAGLKSLSICNVDNSSIVRESDTAILTRAGIEKGVASTKAFATQTMVLWMLALYVGQTKGTIDHATFFFIGRDIFYPLALEGALKLKEISYLHAEGYPAGEMKHGPIALADAELFTIALMPTK